MSSSTVRRSSTTRRTSTRRCDRRVAGDGGSGRRVRAAGARVRGAPRRPWSAAPGPYLSRMLACTPLPRPPPPRPLRPPPPRPGPAASPGAVSGLCCSSPRVPARRTRSSSSVWARSSRV
ncbi:hypothetical protein ABE83_34090 [Streptomyces sp. CFMR 7]|nr:hypothetical protein ABE83_34090 [Streptomyces sp. CFMR 7]